MNVAVYCASSAEIGAKYFDTAHRLGEIAAEKGLTIVNGAGSTGLMAAVADATLAHGGKVIGVIPKFMVDNGWQHTGLSELIETDDMHSRQKKMADMTEAAIVLPGGIGTLAEMSEIICWTQLAIYRKPIVILNTDGYWNDLLRYFEKAHRENFMRRDNAIVWDVADTPEEAVDIILNRQEH